MVVGLLAQVGDGPNEKERVLEIGALDGRRDRAAIPGPGRDGLQLNLDEFLGHSFHGYGIPLPR